MLVIFTSLLAVTLVAASPFKSELSVCQDQYDTQMGKLIASAGIEGAQSVWHLVFTYLDLNHDGVVTATEIAVRMEEESLIGNTDIMLIMREAELWISTSDAAKGHYELDKEKFELLIRTTLGLIEPTPSTKTRNIVENICQLFVRMIPEIAWAMKDTKNCSEEIKNMEKPLIDSGSEQLALNTWYAVFSTMDSNNDEIVDLHEVKVALAIPLTEEIDEVLNLAFGSVMGQTGNITRSEFFNLVTDIVFGSKKKSIFTNVTIPQLHGRQYFCHVLKKVNYDVIMRHVSYTECARVYEGVADIVLGADHIYAPEILFTMADVNRDGWISQSEYEAFTGEMSPLFQQNTELGMDADHFTVLTLVNFKAITDIRHNLNDTTIQRLTKMGIPELIGEEQLCNGMIKALKTFPHRPQNERPYPTQGAPDTTLDQEEAEEQEFEHEMEHYYPSTQNQVQVEPPQNHMAPVEEYPMEEPTVLPNEEEMTTNSISVEEEVHEFVSKSYPEEETNNSHPEHFSGDLETLITNENEKTDKSDEELKLQALLQQMHGEEHFMPPAMHMPSHENLLTEDEEMQLKMLLDNIFQEDAKNKEDKVVHH